MRELLLLGMEYGADAVIIAVITFILTAIIKLPIKNLASKLKNSQAVTRFIVFLPLVISFGVTELFLLFVKKEFAINTQVVLLWLSSTSVSLAIYAVWEKFIPSKSQILSQAEKEENSKIVEEVKSLVQTKMEAGEEINLYDLLLPLIEIAEGETNYSGAEKKDYVMAKVNEFAELNNLSIDEEEASQKIEELIKLTKNVN